MKDWRDFNPISVILILCILWFFGITVTTNIRPDLVENSEQVKPDKSAQLIKLCNGMSSRTTTQKAQKINEDLKKRGYCK
jgi:hypothetical protein